MLVVFFIIFVAFISIVLAVISWREDWDCCPLIASGAMIVVFMVTPTIIFGHHHLEDDMWRYTQARAYAEYVENHHDTLDIKTCTCLLTDIDKANELVLKTRRKVGNSWDGYKYYDEIAKLPLIEVNIQKTQADTTKVN